MRTPRSALGSESSPTDQRTSQPRSEAALCITAEFHNLAPREEAPRIHVAPGKVAPISLAIANVLSISASNGDYTLPHISQDWRGKKIQKKNALIRMFTRSRPKLANMRSFTARRVKNLGFIHLLRECGIPARSHRGKLQRVQFRLKRLDYKRRRKRIVKRDCQAPRLLKRPFLGFR